MLKKKCCLSQSKDYVCQMELWSPNTFICKYNRWTSLLILNPTFLVKNKWVDSFLKSDDESFLLILRIYCCYLQINKFPWQISFLTHFRLSYIAMIYQSLQCPLYYLTIPIIIWANYKNQEKGPYQLRAEC